MEAVLAINVIWFATNAGLAYFCSYKLGKAQQMLREATREKDLATMAQKDVSHEKEAAKKLASQALLKFQLAAAFEHTNDELHRLSLKLEPGTKSWAEVYQELTQRKEIEKNE